MIKLLDTKYKKTMRQMLILLILSDWKEGMTEKELDAIYHMIVYEYGLEWIHPTW